MSQNKIFDIHCRLCPRLADFLDELSQTYPDYHNRPVDAFGAKQASLLIVGLAPGMHGANATGRPFTGDYAGILLYDTLHKYGFASRPQSLSQNDGLRLKNCRITNAVKCLPPQNKPIGSEIQNCNSYLKNELKGLKKSSVVIALGSIAHNAVIRAMSGKQADYKFGHANEHQIGHLIVIDSYHCSRYNTQTKRLTEAMFHAVFKRACELL